MNESNRCHKEADIAVLDNNNKFLMEQVKEIKVDIRDINSKLDLVLSTYTKKSECDKKEIQKWANSKFASKLTEKAVFTTIGIICTIVVSALAYTVIK